jgi:hypothetical protein
VHRHARLDASRSDEADDEQVSSKAIHEERPPYLVSGFAM